MPPLRIAFICQDEYFRIHFEKDLDDEYAVRAFPMQFHQPISFFADVIEYDADFNVFFRGEFLPDGLLEKLRGVTINISSEPFPKMVDGTLHATLDSYWRLDAFLAIRDKGFDYVVHYDAASETLLERLGCRLSAYLPFPIATESLSRDSAHPKTVPIVNDEFDIFFAGRSTPHRERLFGPLKHRYKFLHIESGIFGLELIPFIRKSKITINAHAEKFLSWEPRVQQLLASGAFVLSEPISPNQYLIPNVHFAVADSPESFLRQCEYYLQAEEQRVNIAKAGEERVRSLLSSKVWFRSLFEKINAGKLQSPVFGVNFSLVKALEHYVKFDEFDFVRTYFTSFNELVDR